MSNKLKACFNGCSFTVGNGFPIEQRNEYIYDRLVSKELNFERTNIAKEGSSNYTIFMRSTEALLSKKFDIIFVQWTALNRLWLSPGPGVYLFTNDRKFLDFRYKDLYIKPKELEKFKNTLLLLNHDYQNLLDLIEFCNILEALATQSKTTLVHINGIVPWTNDLTTVPNSDLSTVLSDYTKTILDLNNSDDEEILKHFLVLREKFKNINQSNWVNIFNPFNKNIVDLGPEGHHPGILSHQWMADSIIDYFKKKELI